MPELTVIGKIVEVRGLMVKASLSKLYPPYLISNGASEVAPRINGFVKTLVGLEAVVCQVCGELSVLKQDGETSDYMLELRVLGYFNENKQFVQGLRMLPIVGANLCLLTQDDYRAMSYGGDADDAASFCLGKDLFDQSKTVIVNGDKLMPTHIGVFGNTGSGKSNTLARILSEYADKLIAANKNRAKFLVLDFNNEYGQGAICPEPYKTIYTLSTRSSKGDRSRIPLDLESLSENDFITLLQASEKIQAPIVKNAYRHFLDDVGHEAAFSTWFETVIRKGVASAKRDLINSIRYRLSDYVEGLANLSFHSKHNKFFDKGTDHFFDGDEKDQELFKIEVKCITDPLDLFYAELLVAASTEEDNGTNSTFVSPLLSRAYRLFKDFKKVFDFEKKIKDLFGGKNVCVIQMASVNLDMQSVISSLVGNIVFERVASRKKGNGIPQVVTVVVDEAHRVLNEDSESRNAVQVFEKIVKEGRKFGVFLLVASQRPSDISSTIISQLHNYFIHKLVNPKDIERISKAVAYMDSDSLNLMTVLAPGECIISGTAFQMPRFVHIEQAGSERRPQSENVVIFSGDHALLASEPLEEDGLIDGEQAS
jgi:hypothetical protein